MSGSGAKPIQAVLERFTKWRLPRTLDIKRRIDRGGVLNESDALFLEGVSDDAARAQALILRHPELQPLAARLKELHDDIIRTASSNAHRANVPPPD